VSTRINIPAYLQPYAGGNDVVEVPGGTIVACLDDLIKQYPDISPMLYVPEGKLYDYVSIYVNGEFAQADDLDRPVRNGDELHILYIIGGG